MFKKRLMSKGVTYAEKEDMMAKDMFILEKELGFPVYEDYPLLKYYTQLENLVWYKEKEKEATKSKKGLG